MINTTIITGVHRLSRAIRIDLGDLGWHSSAWPCLTLMIGPQGEPTYGLKVNVLHPHNSQDVYAVHIKCDTYNIVLDLIDCMHHNKVTKNIMCPSRSL